jgi:hypothetical protein
MLHRFNTCFVGLVIFLSFPLVLAESAEPNKLHCPAFVEIDSGVLPPRFELQYQRAASSELLRVADIMQCEGPEFEITMGQIFLAERERLNLKKTALYNDNQNSPEALALLATQALRASGVCHQLICDQVLTQCSRGTTGPKLSQVFNRSNRCETMKQLFWAIHLQEVEALIQANTDKKILGLSREMFRWWEVSFDTLVIDKFSLLSRVLKVIEEKLSNFLGTSL